MIHKLKEKIGELEKEIVHIENNNQTGTLRHKRDNKKNMIRHELGHSKIYTSRDHRALEIRARYLSLRNNRMHFSLVDYSFLLYTVNKVLG